MATHTYCISNPLTTKNKSQCVQITDQEAAREQAQGKNTYAHAVLAALQKKHLPQHITGQAEAIENNNGWK